MKKIYRIFVALMLMAVGAVMPARAQAPTEVIDDINYELDEMYLTAMVIALPGGDLYENDVVIPDKVNYHGDDYTVTTIGYQAFADCKDLTSVTIPTSVYSIEDEAFRRCYSLTSIAVPSSVTSFGTTVFEQCFVLKSVTFEAKIASIPDYTFSDCYNLASFVVPEGVTEIGESAFEMCDALKDISLPSSLTMIGEEAFVDCYSLHSVELPSSLSFIGQQAFAGTGLETLTIPASVTTIGQAAFMDCDELEEITVEAGNTAYCSKEGILYSKDETILICAPIKRESNTLVIPNGVSTIAYAAVKNCLDITHLSLPSSLKTIEDYALYECNNLERIVCFAANPPTITGDDAFDGIEDAELLVRPGKVTYYSSHAQWSKLKTIVEETEEVVDGINYLFYIGPTNRADVTALPDDGKYTGDIEFPDYVKYCGTDWRVLVIRPGAFKDCEDLTSVSLPWYLSEIGAEAFAGCTKLTSYDLEGVTDLGAGAFKGCTGLQSVVFSDLAALADETFAGCTGLQMITCRASSVLPLGADVFKDVNPDIPVYIPYADPADYKADLAWSAYFHNFYGDEFDQIVDGINYRFYPGPKEASVIPLPDAGKYEGNILIPEKVTYLGLDYPVTELFEGAFKDCEDLTGVSLPEGLAYINGEAFSGCEALTEIVIPSSVTFWNGSQFAGCTNLRSVTLPLTTTEIPEFMFTGCSSLDSIVLPPDINFIGDNAFFDCTGMTFLYSMPGFPPTWGTEDCFQHVPNDILVRVPDGSLGDYSADPNHPGWSYFINYIGTEVTVMVDGINYTVNLDTYEAAVKPLPGIEEYEGTVIVPEQISFRDKDYTVTGIGVAAFKDCANLDSIVLPATLEYIDDEAFYGCSGLEEFICLAVTPPTVGTQAFEGIIQANTTGFVPDMHDYYAVLGWEALNLNSKISQVIDGINYWLKLQDYSAGVCSPEGETKYTGDIVIPASVSLLSIPFDVKRIEHGAFSRDYNSSDENLTSVTMPEGLEYIGPYAFSGSDGITAVTIPATVTTIDEGAFMNTDIAEVTVPASVSVLGQAVFSRCDNLTAINVAEANTDYCSVDGVLFTKDMKTLIAFPKHRAASIENYVYTVPEGVETLAYSAFDECQDMAHLVLPATLTNVEDYAFRTADIDTMTCKALTPPTATGYAFFWFNRGYCPLFVQFESIDDYTLADEWKEFSSILSRELFVEVQEATNIHATSADIAWKGTGDSYDLHYKVYDSSDDWTVVEGITETSYHLTGLKDNTPYVVEVRSKYKDKYGEWFSPGSYYFQTLELYTLTYTVDDEVYATEKHEEGETIVLLPNPPAKEGYTFSGWQNPIDKMPNYDYAILGYFELNEYTVRFYDINGNVIKENSIFWNEPAYAPTDNQMEVEGYTFLGWDPADFSHVTEDMDIKPLYKKSDYTLTIIADYGKVSVELNDELIEDLEHFHIGDVLRLTAIPDEGYELDRWTSAFYGSYFSDKKANPTIFTFPANDAEIEAIFTLKKYTVTFVDYNGTVLKTETVQHGSAPVAPEDPEREGYTFTGWDVEFDYVTSDLTVTAQYKENPGTGIDQTLDGEGATKVLRDYHLFIERNGKTYDATGKLVK